MHDRPVPLGGPLWTRPIITLVAIAAFGVALMIWRFAVGLGAVTSLSDGYPWGIWIAYDVVTGTALACGGYAVAILVYVLNKGHYHSLVRPAVLTSALGYTMAAVSVGVDVGRPWNMWKVPMPWNWNTNSVLLEVAMCIFVYFIVLWIELSPAFLERLQGSNEPALRTIAGSVYRVLDRALPFILALGLLLPTMHQSSLGSIMLVARTKLHPLWHSPLLPLLYLISVVGMGYAVVVFESVVTSLVLGFHEDRRMLTKVARTIPPIAAGWVVLRIVDLGVHHKLGLMWKGGYLTVLFWVELALALVPSAMLVGSKDKLLPLSRMFRAAVLLILSGVLYRFDTFIVAFNPGPGWHYFPSVSELLITIGIVAIEILGYVLIVKYLPILTGHPSQPVRSVAAAARGAQ